MLLRNLHCSSDPGFYLCTLALAFAFTLGVESVSLNEVGAELNAQLDTNPERDASKDTKNPT